MEGGKETESQETERLEDSSFVWDDTSQLYFHARSGFYHDPDAGWYYSSRDGLYYKFENGNYVLLQYDKVDDRESQSCLETVTDNTVHENSRTNSYCNAEDSISSSTAVQSDVYSRSGTSPDEYLPGYTECSSKETEIPRPPSEWLEETLINLYLSGYKQPAFDADISTMPLEAEGVSHDGCHLMEYGDQISQNYCTLTGECIMDKDVCRDEENWQAQYGQVVRSRESPLQVSSVVDLWDWGVVTYSRKDGKDHTTRLVGQLVKRSAKLHPSMPSRGGLFRTAPICEAHLDLVRVTTGQVYKLHSPSAKYLATLSSYDSSNPTKGWSFPELLMSIQTLSAKESSGKGEAKLAVEATNESVSMSPNELSTSKKQRTHEYRDRAAERRSLHGGFGVGPGQKSSSVDDVYGATSPVSIFTEEAVGEAVTMTFGAGSYGRKILENMGWKEGEALGSSGKGLIKPIQAVGNMGSAGLGWPQARMDK